MDIVAWYTKEYLEKRFYRGSPRLVMGCPLWGETYTEWFMKYCLPSILAPANRKALDAAGWRLILYTDQDQLIDYLPAGVPIEIRGLPEGYAEAIAENGHEKFKIVAVVHNLLVHEAGRYPEAGFHMLLPDHVYSERFFSNLLWLAWKHPAIVQTSLTCVEADIGPVLEFHRQPDGSLTVPATRLGTLGSLTMTPQWRSWCLSDNETLEQMPNTDFIFWQGYDHIRMHCAHQNLMWLSPNRCRHADTNVGGTLDSELPRYTHNYCFSPQVEDDMGFIALSGGGEPAPIVDFAKFRKDFWANLDGNKDFEKYVRTPCFLPCEPADGFPSGKELDFKFQQVMRKLEEV
jgi:hypothetical protein